MQGEMTGKKTNVIDGHVEVKKDISEELAFKSVTDNQKKNKYRWAAIGTTVIAIIFAIFTSYYT